MQNELRSSLSTQMFNRFSIVYKNPRLLVVFRNKLIFYGKELLTPRPTPTLEDHPCRLSANAYSIFSQFISIPGERLLHPQPEDAPCRGDKGSTWKETTRKIKTWVDGQY
jgi:hypothetical protein